MKEPKAVEHEKQVISAMMNNEKLYYEALPHVEESYLTDEGLKKILRELIKNGSVSADSLIRNEKDPRQKTFIRVVDGAYTNEKDFRFSLEEIKKTFMKRQLYHALNKTINRFDESDYDDLASSIERELNLVDTTEEETIIDPAERAYEAYDEFLNELFNPELAKGMPFSITLNNGSTIGLPSLDNALNGAYGGDLIMIAAKTGVGKTGFALNLARHFSFKQEYRGYYLNTEMRVKEMEARLLAQIARVNANEIMYRRLEGTEAVRNEKQNRIAHAYDQYQKSKLIMSRIPDLPLHKAKGLSKQVKSRYESLDYIIVDYIGRMEIPGKDMNTWDELYEITKQLKELAMILDIPVFMLAQRNQAGDVEGAKKMMNECDAVLYFEPINETDEDYINGNYNPSEADLINYKIVKQKVRRDDNPYPIYVVYDRAKNFINEVV